MTFDSSDLAPLFGDRSPGMRFSQGKIISWNAETFENSVEWRGVFLHNVPVLAGVDALTYKSGDIVSLVGMTPEDGVGSWFILGRTIIPGAGKGEQAIAWMQTELGRAISASVFADRIHSSQQGGVVSTGSDTFVSLSGGPSVSGVSISDIGIAIVTVSANIFGTAGDGDSLHSGLMSFSISGATSVSADNAHALQRNISFIPASGKVMSQNTRGSAQSVITGLNEGNHTFTAQYRTSTGSDDAQFNNRAISVIAL